MIQPAPSPVLFASAGIALAIDPADGGRITSLTAHGREWLIPSPPRTAHDDFLQAGVGGWDEAAPTVGACVLPDGRALADHGDAWRAPWSIVSGSAMEVLLPSVGVTLRRSVSATATGIRLDYRATTDSAEPVPLLWCAHPLFAAPAGSSIVAPSTPLTAVYPEARVIDWPASIDDVPPGSAIKAFASGIHEAAVRHADGVQLGLRWSVGHVGLFWDRGEFSPEPVLAIEPSTGAADLATEVLDTLPTVSSDHPLEWWIELG